MKDAAVEPACSAHAACRKATQLDPRRGGLQCRSTSPDRPPGRHAIAIALDEFTLALVATWLRERAARWPTSTNPRLVVTQRTAVTDAAISKYGLARLFEPLDVNPSRLRTDRLLDEAHHSRDPVKLMRIFGISHDTAIKYVRAAHPELFLVDPTAP